MEESLKKELLEFTKPSPTNVFGICNPYDVKLLTRLRLSLSHLMKYEFMHSFNETINPICIGGGVIESINHFFFSYPEFFDLIDSMSPLPM